MGPGRRQRTATQNGDVKGERLRVVIESAASPFHHLPKGDLPDFIIRPAFLPMNFATEGVQSRERQADCANEIRGCSGASYNVPAERLPQACFPSPPRASSLQHSVPERLHCPPPHRRRQEYHLPASRSADARHHTCGRPYYRPHGRPGGWLAALWDRSGPFHRPISGYHRRNGDAFSCEWSAGNTSLCSFRQSGCSHRNSEIHCGLSQARPWLT